jgi:hypothetical protein
MEALHNYNPRLGLLLLPFILLFSGCTPTSPFLSSGQYLPCGTPCQVVATWTNQVGWTPDPTRGGTPGPVLAGRVYLFGPEIDFPMVGDGRMVVDLYDETATLHGGQPVLLEEWIFNPDDLRRLLKKDAIGWGYTMVMPWGTYAPEVARINLKVRYEPIKGLPLYGQGATITLSHENNPALGLAKRPTLTSPAAALAGQASPSNVRPASFTMPTAPRVERR